MVHPLGKIAGSRVERSRVKNVLKETTLSTIIVNNEYKTNTDSNNYKWIRCEVTAGLPSILKLPLKSSLKRTAM